MDKFIIVKIFILVDEDTIFNLLQNPLNKRIHNILSSDTFWKMYHKVRIETIFSPEYMKSRHWLKSFKLNWYREIEVDWKRMITYRFQNKILTRYRWRDNYVPVIHYQQIHQPLLIIYNVKDDNVRVYKPVNIGGCTSEGDLLYIWPSKCKMCVFPFVVDNDWKKVEKEDISHEKIKIFNYFTPPSIP